MFMLPTEPTALIAGANGRLGRVLAGWFARRGWRVRALVRSAETADLPAGVEVFEGDARNHVDLIRAGQGADVIVNAINVPYTQWDPAQLEIADAMILAARETGATHLFPGNVYNYGCPMPEVISDTTPQRALTRKGALRIEMERRFREAADLFGVQTLILRAGDFFGGSGRGSWFDLVIAARLSKSKVVYPGPLNITHSWAYLPDLAEAFELVALRRAEFETFETFCFPGHTVTGMEMVEAVERALGEEMQVSRLPWTMLRLAAPFVPLWAEVSEIAYLWHVPHTLDGGKLELAIGEIPATPFDKAVADTLQTLGINKHPHRPAIGLRPASSAG